MSEVARWYVDALGARREAPPQTVALFESLLGVPAHATAPRTIVLREDEPAHIDLTMPAMSWTETARWELALEDGSLREGDAPLRDAPVIAYDHRPDGATWDTRRIALGAALPLGSHQLALTVPGYAQSATHVVVVPREAVPARERSWGIAVQLYTLRSQRNLGIGDFADLRAFCALAGARGASYVGINPLHASFRSDPEAASPYAASSRRWLNWLFIAVDELPEAADGAVRALAQAAAARAAALRATAGVDYAGVAALKDELLRACFAALGGTRAQSFAAWAQSQGEALTRFAAYDAIVARYGRDRAAWPATLHTPTSPDVALFAAGEDEELRYGKYLQWCAAEQLEAVARDAARHGVHLYRDLAVGVDANSADVWVDADAYVDAVSVGAPPDVLNTQGQDWGLPPLDPRALARDGYAELLALLEANCEHAGALRIDHAFSLARLYWIPRGADARSGTYVGYPLDDLRGIVALASRRTGCAVIGEDLGTMPPGFRDRMAETGILSYRILFFERADDGSFTPPDDYPARALATSGTHDLPTIPAWLRGEDIALRERFGLLLRPAQAERDERARERALLVQTLVAHGDLAAPDRDDETAIVIAANRYLAASPCAIVMAQLDDILGELAPVNVPGTSSEYPNWRRKLALDLESIAHDPRFTSLCATLNELRPRTT